MVSVFASDNDVYDDQKRKNIGKHAGVRWELQGETPPHKTHDGPRQQMMNVIVM